MTQSDTKGSAPPEFKEPTTSVGLLVALALLGYGYIFLLMIGLLVAALAITYFMLKFHHIWFAKFAFVLVISAGLMVKALFVRFPEPEGLVIEPGYAPRLDELIEELRSKTGCPKIDSILLNGDFNCGIMQHPRLGILGFHKNILVLGLPLLDVIPVDEFKAILAHEMGHISGKHGVISGWLYRVQKSWDQLYEILRRENALGSFFLQLFANWYEPLFARRSLALCREHELAADQLSVNIVGGATTCNALIRTEIVGANISKEMSENLRRAAMEQPEPMKNFYDYLRAQAFANLDQLQIETTLLRASKTHREFDTHPSLGTRLKAIEPERDWSDVKAVTGDFMSLEPIKETPAEFFFEKEIVEIRQQLCDQWYQEKLEGWKANFQELQTMKEELSTLQEVADRGELNSTQVAQMAYLISAVQEADQAIVQLNSLFESFPDDDTVMFHLGVILLAKKNDEGIALIDRAIKLDSVYTYPGYVAICAFLEEHNRSAEADIYAERLKTYMNELSKNGVKTAPSNDVTPAMNRFFSWKILVLGIVVIVAFVYYEGAVHTPPARDTLLEYHDHDSYMRDAGGRLQRNWHRPENANTSRAIRLQFDIDNGGNVSGAKIEHSSGDKSADQAALLALNQSAPFPPIPMASDEVEGFHYTFEDPQIKYADINVYMEDLQYKLKSNWHPPKADHSLHTVVQFTIMSDGTVSKLKVAKSSGSKPMDDAGLQAVQLSVPLLLPPVKEKTVDIEFTFDYNVFSSRNRNRSNTSN